MMRFRPNLVVAGGRAVGRGRVAPDPGRRAVFRVGQGLRPLRPDPGDPDDRTAVRRKEPTRTLARHRRWDGETWFGMNLVPDTPGATMRAGDEVEVLDEVDAADGPPR